MNRMPRRGFVGAAAAGVGAAAMGMAGRARAVGGDEPWDNKVYPSRVPAENYQNIVDALANPRNKVIFLMSTMHPSQGTGKLSFNLTGQETIEITRDVTIVGRDAKIIPGDNPVFTCRSKNIKFAIRDIYFENTTNIPVDTEEVGAEPGLNIIQLAIGGDEPWENPVPPS